MGEQIMKRRAIGIIRVSSDGQDLERQRRDVIAAARAHGLEIVRTLELPDLSGTKVLTDPGVRQVLADLSRSDIHGVCISAIDRLVRPGQLGDLAIFDAFQRARKKIWTPAQELDLSTNVGFLSSGIQGVIAGFERQMILARTSAGKESVRLRGGSASGRLTVPRGLVYKKQGGWAYSEPDASRIKLAYDLLFERRSWHDIAARCGLGLSHVGVRYSLQNPIWKGVRRYVKGRETPLEVPLDIQPLISPERWLRAQEIILEKKTRWAKTTKAPHNLLSGLLRCGCGMAVYVKCAGRPGRRRDYYCCSSHLRGMGPCGARYVRHETLDLTVSQIITTKLLDAAFLHTILGTVRAAKPARDTSTVKLEAERAKLEAERQRLLRMTLKGVCSEADFARESKRIEGEISSLGRMIPSVALRSAFDPAKLIVGLARSFARFASQPFEEQRSLLQTAVREIILEKGGIPAITLNGGFVANLEARSLPAGPSRI